MEEDEPGGVGCCGNGTVVSGAEWQAMPSGTVRTISSGRRELSSCGEDRLGCISRNHRVQLWHVTVSLAVMGRAGCPSEVPPSALAARGAEGIWQSLLPLRGGKSLQEEEVSLYPVLVIAAPWLSYVNDLLEVDCKAAV